MKILLIILGFPLWLPLLSALFAVIISLYVAFWAVVASIWAVFASFAISAPIGVVAGLLNVFSGNGSLGTVLIASGITLMGLTIFAFYGALYATKGSATLTNKAIAITKNAIIKI